MLGILIPCKVCSLTDVCSILHVPCPKPDKSYITPYIPTYPYNRVNILCSYRSLHILDNLYIPVCLYIALDIPHIPIYLYISRCHGVPLVLIPTSPTYYQYLKLETLDTLVIYNPHKIQRAVAQTPTAAIRTKAFHEDAALGRRGFRVRGLGLAREGLRLFLMHRLFYRQQIW